MAKMEKVWITVWGIVDGDRNLGEFPDWLRSYGHGGAARWSQSDSRSAS